MIKCETAVILAGGKSSRMPFNKEFVKDGNSYLVHKTIEKLKKKFKEVIVVTNNPANYDDVIILEDEVKDRGPLAGLSVALKHTASDYVYLMAVDMPNVDYEYMDSLIELEEGYDVYAVNNGYIQTFHAIYHKNVLLEIDNHNSLYRLVNSVNSHIVDFNNISSKLTGVELFFNINDINDLNIFTELNLSKKHTIHRYYKDEFEIITDEVVEEFPITVYINDKKYVTIVCTPESIKELVVGYLNSSGLINEYKDIIKYKIKENRVDITLKDVEIKSRDQILYSACGTGSDFHEKLDELSIEALGKKVTITPSVVAELTTKLAQSSNLFMNTGGVHSALYKINDKTIYKEDIGRHNAVDKIIGHIMTDNLSPNGYLVVSGRLSSDMVLKALFGRIPIVISRSAPTSLALKLAEKYGITLIGFARRNKMNVYTHKYRVK